MDQLNEESAGIDQSAFRVLHAGRRLALFMKRFGQGY